MRLTICGKLIVCFVVLIAVLCVCTGTAFHGLRMLGTSLSKSFSEDVTAADLLGDVDSDLLQMQAESRTTQFQYVVNSVLRVDTSHVQMGDMPSDCTTCHQFGGAEERQRSFAVLADKAARDTRALEPILT